VLEFTRSAEDPNVLDPDSGRTVLSLFNEFGSHNGGWLGFSPADNYLYVLTGDGGNLGRPTDGLPAQDLDSWQGKLLRVDIDGDDFPADDERNYAIPADNPFVGEVGEDEIFAYGLRHPFRGAFDRETGDLYISDVGRALREEIDFLPAGSGGGQNFGWRAKEGTLDGPFGDPIPPDVIDPIHEYPRGGGAAIIGGYVYRGSDFPALDGTYFFTDFVQKDFISFRFDGQQISQFNDRTQELAHPAGAGYGGLVSFAEGGDGEVYFIDSFRGDVFRIVASGLVGDYNGNGLVEQGDLDLVLLHWGLSAAERPPTWVLDLPFGTIDQDELDGVLLNWGASLAAATAVPEPGTAFLLLLVAPTAWYGVSRLHK
jgi:glucose/arabinose dehydrogenase